MTAQLAYLAGFFDGEGSLGHWRSGGGGYASRTFMMSVANTNREIVDAFQAEFGGKVNPKKISVLSKKPQWQWRVHGEEAWACYYKLRPYLREKIWKQEPK